MAEPIVQLNLFIEAGSEATAEELTKLAGDLRGVLLEGADPSIESVEAATEGQAPPGTRADELFVAGALTAMLVKSSDLLTQLVEKVKHWITLDNRRSVKLELDGNVLELNGITLQDQRKLIQLWIDRHTER